MCDFDMSQVELRIMASLAHDQYMINRMKDPEVDSHTEVAADMFYKAAYLISKRKDHMQNKLISVIHMVL